jgi:hypothetical protein
MISGEWRPFAEALAILNHPGHDQKSHGRKGGGPGSGRDLIGSREEAEALASKVLEASDYSQYGPHGDEIMYHIMREQGFDAPATAVPKGQMDAIQAEHEGLYRGVRASRDGSKTPDQIHDEMVSGDAYAGRGVAGNGTYMTSRVGEAGEYGTARAYALHREARVGDHDAIRAEQKTFLAQFGRDSTAYGVWSDTGRYAAAKGYDALAWDFTSMDGTAGRRVIVLNRGSVFVEEGP